MPQREIIYDPFAYQIEFQRSTAPKCYLSTGYGGGKTYSLIMKMFQLMSINKGMPGGILAPTIKMYKRDVVPTIQAICRENNIPYKYNKSDMEWYFPDTHTMVYAYHSQDEGDSIKGPNLAWFIGNEITLCKKNAFLAALARIRLAGAVLPQFAISGTPEGFNWTYEYFVQDTRADTDMIYGDCTLNPHVGTFYYDNLRESYDEQMQKQYIKGLFVNLVGKNAAWAFDRMKHTDVGWAVDDKIIKIPGAPVLVSLDFNVAPMAATLWNRTYQGEDERTGKTREVLRGFDEIMIDGSNTYEMVDAIKERLDPGDDVVIYPDPAGRARSTKTRNITDFDILRDYGEFEEIKYRTKISVRDCVNALNNSISKGRIELSAKCTDTIADLEQCIFKKNVYELDKSNDSRTHWFDGTKNMVEFLFPIRNRPGFRQQRMR